MKTMILAALALGTAAAGVSPALAQPARFDASLTGAAPSATLVQFQGDDWRRHGGGGRGWRGGRGWNGGRHGGGYGYGVGAGVAGLAAGAIIGGAIASQAAPAYGYDAPQQAGGDQEGYCMQRYQSYDPGSGTYLGYDGLRHPCP